MEHRQDVQISRGAVPPGLLAGSGDGSGSGSGSGYGSGSGDGSGDGYGYGDGSGYGSGYGSGSGYGYGDGEYWRAVLITAVAALAPDVRARVETLRTAGAVLAFWRSDADGRPANGGRCESVAPGTVHRETGPLRTECGRGQLHATLKPDKWKGERWWIVALIGEVRGDEEKYWALEREVIAEFL